MVLSNYSYLTIISFHTVIYFHVFLYQANDIQKGLFDL